MPKISRMEKGKKSLFLKTGQERNATAGLNQTVNIGSNEKCSFCSNQLEGETLFPSFSSLHQPCNSTALKSKAVVVRKCDRAVCKEIKRKLRHLSTLNEK